MRLILSLILLIPVLLSPREEAQQRKVLIQFDKNIELVGYLIHLVDPDDNDPEHPITIELNKYPDDRHHPALANIFALAADLDYGTIIRLLYTLPDFPLSETYMIPDTMLTSLGFESASEHEEIRELITNVQQFSKESGFQKLWVNLKPFRDSTKVLIDENKPSHKLLKLMEEFYQQEFSNYYIIPSLTLWSGPGWGFRSDSNTATFILGPLTKNYNYSDSDALQTLSIHEFGHSFVNATVLDYSQQVVTETSHLYESIKENMERQGYGNWSTSMVEHFVRSGEVILAEQIGNTNLKEKLLTEFVEDREFIYLPFIVDKLTHYRYQKELSYDDAVMLTLKDFQEHYSE